MKPYKPYTADEMVALWEEICLVVVKAMRNLRKEYRVQPGEEKAADED